MQLKIEQGQYWPVVLCNLSVARAVWGHTASPANNTSRAASSPRLQDQCTTRRALYYKASDCKSEERQRHKELNAKAISKMKPERFLMRQFELGSKPGFS